jgi:hypothetical protein
MHFRVRETSCFHSLIWLFLLLDLHRECGSSHIEALILEYKGSVVLELQLSWQQLITAIHDRRWWIWCSVSSSSHKFATTVIWWCVATKCIVVKKVYLCNLSWTWSLWYCHANNHTSSGSADSLPLITSLNCSLFWICFHVGFFYTFDYHLTCSWKIFTIMVCWSSICQVWNSSSLT